MRYYMKITYAKYGVACAIFGTLRWQFSIFLQNQPIRVTHETVLPQI